MVAETRGASLIQQQCTPAVKQQHQPTQTKRNGKLARRSTWRHHGHHLSPSFSRGKESVSPSHTSRGGAAVVGERPPAPLHTRGLAEIPVTKPRTVRPGVQHLARQVRAVAAWLDDNLYYWRCMLIIIFALDFAVRLEKKIWNECGEQSN